MIKIAQEVIEAPWYSNGSTVAVIAVGLLVIAWLIGKRKRK